MLTLSGDGGVVGPGLAAVAVSEPSDAGAVSRDGGLLDVEIVGELWGVLGVKKKVLEKGSYSGL